MTIENFMLVLTASMTGILVSIGAIITVIYAVKNKKRLIFLFSAMWLMYAIFWFIDAVAHYYYSIFIMSLAILPQLIGVPCIIVFIELIKKEHVSPIKISILIIIEALLLYVTFFVPGNFEIIPGYGVHNKGILRVLQIVFLFYFVSLYFIWSYQTWRRAPASLKRLTSVLLIGSTLFSVVTAAMYALGTFVKTFNSIAFIVNGIGAFTTIIVILKDPRIIFILPFKAYRILIIDTNGSVALYKHDWANVGALEENMFTMMLQAIGNVLDDILKKGEVQEIQMDRAVLLIHHDKTHSIASVLIASKSSKSLRYGLKKFNREFIETFQSQFDQLYEVSRFKDAKKIVDHIFDFVPEY
ncbi:MAG: hypothetical protein KAW66_12770, partial [Candidatus Lokiarchaeota archaeon]|nr:hypothetical protein [Candidatus Lokiarchaeota archaeon]